MEFANLLSPAEVERIHQASLQILEEDGLLVRNVRAREILRQHGCHLDTSTNIVRFPRRVVEEFRRAFPPSFTFRGRDPAFDRTIPADRPVMVTGSTAPYVIDPHTGRQRPATSTDIANIAYLVNELPGYDVFSVATLAQDAPPGYFSLARFYPALKNCRKPVRGNTPSLEELHKVLELGIALAGSEEAYRERPLITHHCCPVVSPLTMDVDSTDILIYLVEQGLPVYATVVPNAGLTAPMTLEGTLALGNAEFLAVAVLMQMVRPHTPLIYAVLSTVADLRTGSYTPGAIETGMLLMAHSQMARFYGVPAGGYVGLTNSHTDDAQAGYETGMNTTCAVLGGADMLNMGGLLSSLMDFDFAKVVIDNEIALMLKRLQRKFEVNDDNLSLDEIAAVGPGGSFLESSRTLRRMRSTALLTNISSHESRDQWEEHGRLDTQKRALSEAIRILSQPNRAAWPPEIDARIKARFPGLISGEAGWENLAKLAG